VWLVAAATDDDYVDGNEDDCDDEKMLVYGLSHTFIDPTLQMREYFIEDFGEEKSEFHMNPYWATHVLASLLRIRVIVYQHNVYEDPPVVWSVISFEYNSPTHSTDNPHVKVVWIVQLQNKADLEGCRISDTEYKRIPTIELLFSYYGSDVGQHFQRLRCVVCSGVNETQVTRNESVYSYLENQLRTSTKTNTKLRGVRSTTSREKPSPKKHISTKRKPQGMKRNNLSLK